MKPFTTLAVVVFTLVAILHLLRILNHWDVEIAGTAMPMWASYLGLLVAVLLAVMVRRESGRGSEGGAGSGKI